MLAPVGPYVKYLPLLLLFSALGIAAASVRLVFVAACLAAGLAFNGQLAAVPAETKVDPLCVVFPV